MRGECSVEDLRTRGTFMWGGTLPSAGVDGGCLVEGGVTRRVLWLWSADGRFSRELVETGDFTEGKGACLRIGETWP